MSVQDDERADSDIRKRAAGLLAMLAVVAGLFVVLSLTLFHTSRSDPDQGQNLPTTLPSSTASSGPSTGSTAATSPAASTSDSSGPVPKPACPGSTSCAVRGDVSGTMNAINAYRAEHGKKPVPITSNSAADRCALTSGSDCPSSFVWVRVNDLSGASVVKAVSGFNSSDDLLADSASSFEVGWAYNPSSKNLSCALIRVD